MKYCYLLLALLTGLILNAFSTTSINENKVRSLVNLALSALQSGSYSDAANYLNQALTADPSDVDANQLYGTLVLKSGSDKNIAVEYYERAIRLSGGSDLSIYSNYIEALRASNRLMEAHAVGNKLISTGQMKPTSDSCTFYLNLGIVERLLGNFDASLKILDIALQCDIKLINAWVNAAELLTDMGLFSDAEALLKNCLSYFPEESYIYFLLGAAVHHQQKLDQALQLYLYAEKLNPTHHAIRANIAAALQALGRSSDALYYYESVLPHLPNDAGIRNNYGALLGTMNRKEEEVYWLKQALELEPDLEHALVNLGGYFQDEGLLSESKEYLSRAINASKTSATLLNLRMALMMSPISISWQQMATERNTMKKNVVNLIKKFRNSNISLKTSIDTSLDRIHFYIPYHGLNDRAMEELIVEAYGLHLHEIGMMAPNVGSSFLHKFFSIDTLSKQQIQQLFSSKPSTSFSSVLFAPVSIQSSIFQPMKYLEKKRIGFMSKFFGIFEPHGMLLDGIMKYLPRQQFLVVCMLVARSDGKPAAPSVIESCDEVHEISLTYQHAFDNIKQLNLDILVFADLVSEPINHFMALQRLAPIQMAFWGNPITSGSDTIDFFISADIMEHPYRTRLLPGHDPYSEQVVLTEGQGIWYFPPIDPADELKKVNISHLIGPIKTYTRQDFGLSDDWFVYLLPQSVFKIHPLYELVLASILIKNPNSHLLVTGGRRPRWTKLYLQRLKYVFGEELSKRLHVAERVSSENFYNLLKLADVILHPFPFDGSRTSADSLIVNVPYVTLPSEYLRGRMGYAFLRTMNIPELVAVDIPNYIEIAVKLSYDNNFHRQMREKIAQTSYLIWEDMEVPYTWTRMMQRINGLNIFSYQEFLQQAVGNNAVNEYQKSELRKKNQAAFDEKYQKQLWTLTKDAKGRHFAELESFILNDSQWPNIFEYWKKFELSKFSKDKFTIDMFERVAKLANKKLFSSEPNFFEIFSEFSGVPMPVVEDETSAKKPKLRSLSSAKVNNIGASTFRESTVGKTKSDHQNMLVDPLPNNDWKQLIETFRRSIKLGDFTDAKRVGGILSSRMRSDYDGALFLLDYGALYYMSGEYTKGRDLCVEAIQLSEKNKIKPSSMMYACVGMASMYIPNHEQYSLDHLIRSYNSINEMIGNQISSSSLMTVTKGSLENSLLTSFQQYKEYQQCIIISKQIISNDFPSSFLGSFSKREVMNILEIYVIVFSVVHWSPEHRSYIEQMEVALQQQYPQFMQWKITSGLQEKLVLWDELKMIQSSYAHILGSILTCIQEHEDLKASFQVAMQTLIQIITLIQQNSFLSSPISQIESTALKVEPRKRVALVTQYFISNHSVIQEDINRALIKNLANPFIDDIYQLLEAPLPSNYFSAFPNPHKLHNVVIGRRLQFSDAFLFANENFASKNANVIVVLANADIYFDYSIGKLLNIPFESWQSSTTSSPTKRSMILALLKWMDHVQYLSLPLRVDSQDVWIFTAPVPSSVIEQSKFALGLPRCDNRIAEIFDQANYSVQNTAFDIHGIEIQSYSKDGHGSIYGVGNAVGGAGKYLFIQDKLDI